MACPKLLYEKKCLRTVPDIQMEELSLADARGVSKNQPFLKRCPPLLGTTTYCGEKGEVNSSTQQHDPKLGIYIYRVRKKTTAVLTFSLSMLRAVPASCTSFYMYLLFFRMFFSSFFSLPLVVVVTLRRGLLPPSPFPLPPPPSPVSLRYMHAV